MSNEVFFISPTFYNKRDVILFFGSRDILETNLVFAGQYESHMDLFDMMGHFLKGNILRGIVNVLST